MVSPLNYHNVVGLSPIFTLVITGQVCKVLIMHVKLRDFSETQHFFISISNPKSRKFDMSIWISLFDLSFTFHDFVLSCLFGHFLLGQIGLLLQHKLCYTFLAYTTPTYFSVSSNEIFVDEFTYTWILMRGDNSQQVNICETLSCLLILCIQVFNRVLLNLEESRHLAK